MQAEMLKDSNDTRSRISFEVIRCKRCAHKSKAFTSTRRQQLFTPCQERTKLEHEPQYALFLAVGLHRLQQGHAAEKTSPGE